MTEQNRPAQDSIRMDMITIAAGNPARMAEFYSKLLHTTFESVDRGGFTFYKGQVAGITLQLCPKELAGISATQNLHQLRFQVPDLHQRMELALASGGQLEGDVVVQGARQIACLRDPDGNTVELLQDTVA